MVNRMERPTKNAIVNPINVSGLLMMGRCALSGLSLGFGQLVIVDMILLLSTAYGASKSQTRSGVDTIT
jgi:hypothetical protein